MESNEISGVVQMGQERVEVANRRISSDVVLGVLMDTAAGAGLWLTGMGARAIDAGKTLNEAVITMGAEATTLLNRVSPAAAEMVNQGRELVTSFLATHPNALVDAALVGAGITFAGWTIEQVVDDVQRRKLAQRQLEQTIEDITRVQTGLTLEPAWIEQRSEENAHLAEGMAQVRMSQLPGMIEQAKAGGPPVQDENAPKTFPVKDFTKSNY